jgi:hypothetical protein
MHCKSCGYALWNIGTRACPECGAGFKPSDYEFVPNSVRFCCPHCKQKYFGTTAQGHLDPRAFNCVSCQQAIDMDEMLLLPDEGVEESKTVPHSNPYLPDRVYPAHYVKRWARTVGMSLVQPGKLGASINNNDPKWAAMSFMAVTALLVTFVGAVGYFLFMGAFVTMIARAAGPGGGGGPPGGFLFWAGPSAVMLVLGLLVWIVGCAVWGLLAHLILRLTGPTDAGVRRTLDTVYYASGTGVLYLVPCLGQYGLATIWMLVSGTVMLSKSQRVSGGRAALAFLAPPGLALLAFIAFYAVVVYVVFSGINAAAATTPGVLAPAPAWRTNIGQVVTPRDADDRLKVLAQAMEDYRTTYGVYPRHAAKVCVESGTLSISPQDFLLESSHGSAAMIGQRSIAALETLTPAIRDAHIRSADALASEGVVAHRVGDFVFVYPPGEKPVSHQELWTAVFVPMPSVTHDPSIVMLRVAARADGTTTTIPYENWPDELQKQNELRRKLGLPPLPDLEQLTDREPALLGSGLPEPGLREPGLPEPAGAGGQLTGGPSDADKKSSDRP